MHVEYEEFNSVEDIFKYMTAAAPPMKNTLPINSYKDYVFSFIPLSPSTGSNSSYSTCIIFYEKIEYNNLKN